MTDSRKFQTFRRIGRILRVAVLASLATAAVLAIAVLGYSLGWKTWEPRTVTSLSKGNEVSPPTNPLSASVSSPETQSPSAPESLLKPIRPFDSFFAEARTAVRYAETEALGIAQVHHMLGALEENELRNAFHHVANLPVTESRKELIRALLGHWVSVDPAAAFAALRQDLSGHEFFDQLYGVFNTWAREDPVAAYQAYTEQVRPEANSTRHSSAEFNLSRIFRYWSGENFEAALAEFGNLDGDEARYALRGIATTTAENLEDSSFVEPLFELSTDARITAFSHIARFISQRDDPGSAIAWLETLPVKAKVRTSIESEIASEWAWTSPREAAAWALSSSQKSGDSESLRNVVRRWADWEPNAAGEWLHQLEAGTGLADDAFSSFAVTITADDAESALAWAAEIQSPETRQKTLKNIGHRLHNRRTPEAETLIRSSPLSAIEQAALLEFLE